MKAFLERVFKLKDHNTNVKTEVIAGITTFLTMVYIVPLNGIIMSQGGMPIEAVISVLAFVL